MILDKGMDMTDNYAPDLALFVSGSWRVGEGRDHQAVINPATGATLADVPLASAADLDEALDAADKGFKLWRATDVETRGGILRKAAALMRERSEDIARMLTTEQGKPLVEARGEVAGSASMFDWYAEEAKRAYGKVLVRPTGQRSIVICVDCPLAMLRASGLTDRVVRPWRKPCRPRRWAT